MSDDTFKMPRATVSPEHVEIAYRLIVSHIDRDGVEEEDTIDALACLHRLERHRGIPSPHIGLEAFRRANALLSALADSRIVAALGGHDESVPKIAFDIAAVIDLPDPVPDGEDDKYLREGFDHAGFLSRLTRQSVH